MKIILFDVDGVLAKSDKVFSDFYSDELGLEQGHFNEFFRLKWPAIVTGKKDLKEAIEEDRALWRLKGPVDELLQLWFDAENVVDEELVELIAELIPTYECYLATDQEKYRGKYIRDVMFKGVFKGYFISSDIGYTKKSTKYFEHIIAKLRRLHPDLKTQNIIFFDDTQSKIDTALECGIDARLYKSIDQVRALL